MFEEINMRRAEKGIEGPQISPSEPAGWEDRNWPSGNKFLLDRVALARRAFVNRCSENIYKACSAIFSEHRLHVTVDNWGVYRASATKCEVVDRPCTSLGPQPVEVLGGHGQRV